MSRHDFTEEEYAFRRDAVSDLLLRKQLDWLIVIHPRSIHWLTGCRAKSYQAFQCLFFSASGDMPAYFCRISEQLEVEAEALAGDFRFWGGDGATDPVQDFADVFAALGLGGKNIGIERPGAFLGARVYERIAAACGTTMTDATDLIDMLRLTKSDAEQVYIRRAADAADRSMAYLQANLVEGKTELALAGEIYHAATVAGGEFPASPINLSAGPRGLFCHAAPNGREVEKGDVGNAEYAIPYNAYPVSIGRQFCIGQPTNELTDLVGVLSEAVTAAIGSCAAGVPASAVYRAARDMLVRSGVEQHRVHTMGYAMATAFPPATGESFHISPINHKPLQAGMHLSLCPNLFATELGMGVRLVDNILITKGGTARLTKFPHETIQGRLLHE